MEQKNVCKLAPMPVIRIDKTSLRTIIGTILTFSEPSRKTVTRSIFCQSCPYGESYTTLKEQLHLLSEEDALDFSKIKKIKSEMDSLDRMCINSNCTCCEIKTEYMNEKKQYGLYNTPYNTNKRISKSALKLYLLLYSLPQALLGSTHFIKNVSAEKLAEYLECTTPTIKRCLKNLEQAKYITLCHASDYSHFNIIINSYDTMPLTADKGGNGYITITKDTLDNILSIKNVNLLRLELLRLLRYDSSRVAKKSSEITWEHYSIKDLKNILPSHMNYLAKYNDILSDPRCLFNSFISHGTIYFTPKNDKVTLNCDYERLQTYCKELLITYLKENELSISPKELNDIGTLATQYDISTIFACTEELLYAYAESNIKIRNLPALIRKACYDRALCIA